MRKLSELKTFLNKYIKDYKELEKRKDTLISDAYIYENILNILSDCISGDYNGILNLNKCLNSLFGNKYDELCQNIFICDKLQKINQTDSSEYKKIKVEVINMTNEIKEEYLKIRKDIEDILDTLALISENNEVSRRVINSLKYSQLISNSDISVINTLLRDSGYDNTDVAFIVENLFLHNNKNSNKNDKYDMEEKNKFINLLSLGSEVFDYPLVEDEIKLSNLSSVIYGMLENYQHEIVIDNYISILPEIDKDVDDIDEWQYLVISVLEKIRDTLNEKVELIKDPDFIMDLEIKNELANECYQLMEKYILIRNYLNEVLNKENEEVDNTNEKNNVFYLVNKNGKCYFTSDFEGMPFEYLEKTMKLINDFKENTIGKKKNKRLVNYAGNFSELKGDQIRVIYKRIKDNNYLIFGAFVKKDDRTPRELFINIINRNGVISENPQEIEEQLNEYVSKNKRKWTR